RLIDQHREPEELHVEFGDLQTKIPANANSECNPAQHNHKRKLQIMKPDRVVSVAECLSTPISCRCVATMRDKTRCIRKAVTARKIPGIKVPVTCSSPISFERK